MLPPRIKIATDILRSLAKLLDQYQRRRVDSSKTGAAPSEVFALLKKNLHQHALWQVNKHFSDIALISEEESSNSGSENFSCPRQWVLETLSDKDNFFSNCPDYALRLTEIHGEQLIFSLIYLPKSDEIYCAERGFGLRLNQHRLRAVRKVSSQKCWRIGAPMPISALKACIMHFENFCAHERITAPLEFLTMPSLSHQIAALCSDYLDVCWSGELTPFHKKFTGFWIKEAAFHREVLKESTDHSCRSWIFGNFPTANTTIDRFH